VPRYEINHSDRSPLASCECNSDTAVAEPPYLLML
jgi:hypothetical protein